MKLNRFLLNLSFFAAFLALCPFAFSAATDEGAPIQVHGDSVEYFHELQKVEAVGNVSIDYEDVKLTADKMTVFTNTKMATAEGHVVLTQRGSIFKGEHAEYNFGKKTGNVSQMSMEMPPSYYGKAQGVERVSVDHYRAINSYVTTCCGDNPFYKVQAHQVDIFPGKMVSARNAVLWVRGIPVLWVPYFETRYADFERFPIQLVPGKTSEWGPFLLSRWRYHLIDTPEVQSKGNVLLDYRHKKGFGGGVENYYNGEKVGHGAIRTYYANDNNPPQNFDEDRSRIQWRHQSKLTEDTTLTAEINDLSDPLVVKDFFYREEFEEQSVPENYVSIITSKPEYTFSVLARERIDDFYTVVQREPQLRFDTHNQQLFDTLFYFRQEVQYDSLSKVFADGDGDLEAQRLDLNHTLSYAGHVGNFSVTPRAGVHNTAYSRRSGDTEGLFRGAFEPGLDLSTRFFKTYETSVHALGLDYNGIRHIFTPTASYNFRPNPTALRTTLQQFDAIDALDKQNYFRFNFENKLQTKEHDPSGNLVSREIVRIIPFFDQNFDTGRIENVGYDLELRPYSWMGIESDATFDTVSRDFETVNADFYLTRGDFRYSLGQRYAKDESSQTTTELRWKINPQWETKIYERYEFETNESKEFELGLSRTFNCVIVDLTYNHRQEHGDTFFVALRLKAFPKASFGMSQSYSSPKAASRL